MSQVVEEVMRQERWLLGQLTQNARIYLEMAERLEALPHHSEEAAELMALMYARVQQLRMDAEDVIEAMDADDEGDGADA